MELLVDAVVLVVLNFKNILNQFLDINCWQCRSNLSASAAALFDTVLIARHIPHAIAAIDLERDQLVPSLLPPANGYDVSVRGDCTSVSSSAFSDGWSCAESQSLESTYDHHTLYARSKDLLSEMGSISSTELSAFLDDSDEWPYVQVCNSRSTNRLLPATENFVAELKGCVPVSHGLVLGGHGRNAATLPVRSAELVKPDVHQNGSRCTDSIVKLSNCKVPEKRKEITLYPSTVESSVCSVEETETFQKVVVGESDADRIQTDDRNTHLHPEDLCYSTSTTACTVKSGLNVDSKHAGALYRSIVEPDFCTMWSEGEDSCRTRLIVCQRELVDFGDYASDFKTRRGACTEADSDVAVELCHQLKNRTLVDNSAQITAAAADDGGRSAAVQPEEVGVVKYERCDIDNRLSVKLRHAGISRSAEQLNDDKHSLHSVTLKAPHTDRERMSASNQSMNTYVLSDEIHRATECISKQSTMVCQTICRISPVNKYLDGCKMSLSCDNVADLNMTAGFQRSESGLDVDRKTAESSLYSLRWTEHRAHPATRESDRGWLVKDISASSSSLSTCGRLAVMGDMSSSLTRHHSCDVLLPDALDSPNYLDLYGRGIHRHYQNQTLKSLSSENVAHSYSSRTVRPLIYEKKLELLPTLRTSPTDKHRQTVVARQSPSTSRIHYIRAASEPHRVSDILPYYLNSNTVSSKLDVKSQSLQCKYNHGKREVNNATSVHNARRNSLDGGLYAERAGEGLSSDMYSRVVSDVLQTRQTVTHSDGTNVTYSDKHNDEDANRNHEQWSLDTYRNNYDRETAEQPLMGSFDGYDRLYHPVIARNEDLLSEAVSASSVYKSKEPAGLSAHPIFEGDAKKAGMEYLTASTEECSVEQSAVSAVVPDVLRSEEMSKMSCEKPAQHGCIERLGTSSVHNNATAMGKVTALDGDLEASGEENSTVTELNDVVDTDRILHKIHDVTVDVQTADMQSRTTVDTPAVIVTAAENCSYLETTQRSVERTTSDSSDFTASMVKDTALSEKRLETFEMISTKLNDGSQSATTLDTCQVTASVMNDVERSGDSLDSSTMAAAEPTDGVDAAENLMNESKDIECSVKTLDIVCEMAAVSLKDSHMTSSSAASHSGMAADNSDDTLDWESGPSELAVTSPDDTVHLRTSPDADSTVKFAAESEKSLDASEMASLTEDAHSQKTPSTSDTKTTKLADTVDTRNTPVSDQVNYDDNDLTDMTDDSVSDTAADSSVNTPATYDKIFSDMSILTVAAPDDYTNSYAEISASVSVPVSNDDGKLDCGTVAIPISVINSQADILADKSDMESDITTHDYLCRVIESCEEVSSHQPVTVISSISNSNSQTVDITDDEDVQVVSYSEITSREDCVRAVSCGEGVLQVPVRSNEALADSVSHIRDSAAGISSLSLDLSERLADSIFWSTTDKFIDRGKADQQPMSQTSDQVNSKLRDGNTCMYATVAVAY